MRVLILKGEKARNPHRPGEEDHPRDGDGVGKVVRKCLWVENRAFLMMRTQSFYAETKPAFWDTKRVFVRWSQDRLDLEANDHFPLASAPLCQNTLPNMKK